MQQEWNPWACAACALFWTIIIIVIIIVAPRRPVATAVVYTIATTSCSWVGSSLFPCVHFCRYFICNRCEQLV